MNKYQEALDNIVIESCKHARAFDVGCKNCKLKSHCNRDAKSWVMTLQELIDNGQTINIEYVENSKI